jgi:hypothetical protein
VNLLQASSGGGGSAEEEDERGRKFTLTESNFGSETNPKEILKENVPPGSGSILSSSSASGVGVLSSAAEQYLKSLPDLSFMLTAPNVENGKE